MPSTSQCPPPQLSSSGARRRQRHGVSVLRQRRGCAQPVAVRKHGHVKGDDRQPYMLESVWPGLRMSSRCEIADARPVATKPNSLRRSGGTTGSSAEAQPSEGPPSEGGPPSYTERGSPHRSVSWPPMAASTASGAQVSHGPPNLCWRGGQDAN